MEQKNQKWINFSFNPWNKRIEDCAIRAIAAATGLDYRVVCKKLGYACKNGYGLTRKSGASIQKIKNVFNDYFDIIEDFYDNFTFVPDEFKGSEEVERIKQFEVQNGLFNSATGTTLNEFIDLYKNQGTFLVSLIGNPDSENPSCRGDVGHLVCVKCNPGYKQGFIDFWDSGDMLVNAFMRVKKFEPKDSPNHWRYDREKHKFIV